MVRKGLPGSEKTSDTPAIGSSTRCPGAMPRTALVKRVTSRTSLAPPPSVPPRAPMHDRAKVRSPPPATRSSVSTKPQKTSSRASEELWNATADAERKGREEEKGEWF
jgi:hypothetical protein